MEHEFMVNGSFVAAAIQMLLGMCILFQRVLRTRDILFRIARLVIPYFYSFSPVVLLIYVLYAVSFNLR